MKMAAKYIWEFGALIFLILGSIHLVYTFFTNKFLSNNEKVIEGMKSSSPILTKETTMWKAWIGFNASHSLGAILFGMIYGYLAMVHPGLLFDGLYLSSVGFLMLTTLLVLAKRYWFHVPYRGIMIALVLFTAAQVIAKS